MFLYFLCCVFEHFEPPKIFQEIEGFKANFFPVSWKQESVKVVCEEAFVIFVWALGFNPNFTFVFILSESRKKASVNSNYFRNYAFLIGHCVGNERVADVSG